MKNLFRNMKLNILYIFCFIMFTSLFMNFDMRTSLAFEDVSIPIYIIKDNDKSEIVIDRTNIKTYKVDKIKLKNLTLDTEIQISPINQQFFIYENLKDKNEYQFDISFIDRSTRGRLKRVAKFRYIENKFSIKNVKVNSCDIVVKYDRKDSIFIDGIKIFGRDNKNNTDEFDINLEKSKDEITNNVQNQVEFNNVGLKPSRTYTLGCITSTNDDVNLVLKKTVRTKPFEISNLRSRMISEDEVNLNWDVNTDNFQFVNRDSIKVFVKGLNDINYSDVPDLIINDMYASTGVVKLKNVSPKYEIKLAYNFSGELIEDTIEQINDFYKLNTKVDVVNLKDLMLQYSFNTDGKFKNGEKFNIYIVDVNDEKSKNLISTIELEKISPNTLQSFEYKKLKVDTQYKLLYEIVYPDGQVLKLKEEEFRTKPFDVSDITIDQVGDYEEQLNLKISWNLVDPKFNFNSNDSLSIYIKDKYFSDYPIEPIFYANKDMNNLRSCTLPIDLNSDLSGEFDIKFIYNVDGKNYTKYLTFEIPNNGISLYGEPEEEESDLTDDPDKLNKDKFLITVKDKKVNEIILGVRQAKESESFKYTDGDTIKIVAKLKNPETKNKDKLLDRVIELIHSSKPEETTENNNQTTGSQGTTTENGSSTSGITEEQVKQENKEEQTNKDVKKVDLSKLSEISVDYLAPNREYDISVDITTKQQLPDGEAVILPLLPGTVSGESPKEQSLKPSTYPINTEHPDEEVASHDEQSGGVSGTGPVSHKTIFDNKLRKEYADASIVYMSSILEQSKTKETSSTSNQDNSGNHIIQKNFTAKTLDFKVTDFKLVEARPNSASFSWKVACEDNSEKQELNQKKAKEEEQTNQGTNTGETNNGEVSEVKPEHQNPSNETANIKFNEKDKVDIYVKRKIVNGYPAGGAFEKIGSQMSGVTKGDVVVSHMNMEYDAKIVYLISGVKFEQTCKFTTTSAKGFCVAQDITEHSARLNIVYPEKYVFVTGDSLEIYVKEKDELKYPKSPVIRMEQFDGEQNIVDMTSFNLIALKPDMMYDVLIKFLTKSNDIPDVTVQLKTKKLVIENCRIESMNGSNLRIQANLKDKPLDILDYIQLYVDVFYKPADRTDYLAKPLKTTSGVEALDFEMQLPDRFRDYDFLVSYNPHGFFNDKYFIEYELPYRTIKPRVEESEIEENGVTRKSFNLLWEYAPEVRIQPTDKLDIYLKKLPQDTIETKKNYEEYTKILTIGANITDVTQLNLDSFIEENNKYSVVLEPVCTKFSIGPGTTEFTVGTINSGKAVDEIIFEAPVAIEEYNGVGDNLNFPLPDLYGVNITEDMEIDCGIDGVTAEISDDGNVSIKGLVPCKEYDTIEIKIIVEEGKEIVFNMENIKLEAEDKKQQFLYDVYQRSFLRDPDESGYQYWLDRLANKTISARDFLINLLFAEKEFSELEYTTDKLIEILYSIIVDRDPDPEGLKFWIDFYTNEALINAHGDVFLAKKVTVDRMINEQEFAKLIQQMGLLY